MSDKSTKEFGQIKILSLAGSRLYHTPFDITGGDGSINYDLFEGYLDESLETIKFEEVCKLNNVPFKFYPPKKQKNTPYTLALINVTFTYTIRQFYFVNVECGRLFIAYGHSLDEVRNEIKDHVYIQDDKLLAIEIPYDTDVNGAGKYAPVKSPVAAELLQERYKFFSYDPERRCYEQTKKVNKNGEIETLELPVEIDSKEIRDELYTNGFICNGAHYVRYKRSAGSSREGTCLFIDDSLVKDMTEWSWCGIDGTKIADQASFQAYISLTLSSIQKTIKLSQRSILILKDQESCFEEPSVRVHLDGDSLKASHQNVRIKNKIWDGEGLLDESVFYENDLKDKGMMVLRNRFFKTCAFNTKLQKWFADNGITDISQLNGCHQRNATLSDIKLVVTESSLKYCKMLKGMTLQQQFDHWLENAFEGKTYSYFGLVKTEKPTALMKGKMVRTNYQLLNTLGLDRREVDEFLKDSFDYLHNIMHDPVYLRYYIKLLLTNQVDFDEEDQATSINYRAKTVFEMMKRSDEFTKTKYFREFRGDTVTSIKRKMKKGRIQVDGTYATICGNGAELLQAVIDKNYVADTPIALKDNEIRTTQFGFDKDLLCARSPHITMGNLFVARNVDNDIYSNYFNFEKAREIVCINAIDHNIQQRLNGCDYDSDTMLITDNAILLNAANRIVDHFPVPVADFAEDEIKNQAYDINDPKALSELDRKISSERIGEIVNLSQFLNSLYWDKIATGLSHEQCFDLYCDICKLAVLSGIEIDRAKRSNNVDSDKVLRELQTIKKQYKDDNDGKLPAFYTYITTGKVTTSPARLETTMAYVYDAVEDDEARAKRCRRYTSLGTLFALESSKATPTDQRHAQAIIDKVETIQKEMSRVNIKMRGNGNVQLRFQREILDDCYLQAVEACTKHIKTDAVLDILLKELDNCANKISALYALLFASILFETNHRLLNRVVKRKEPLFNLELTEDQKESDIKIFGYTHVKKSVDDE